ncbi:recombinase family protein [Glycomyces sp. L485]|uniref:recombinase family protein n=1 Tax=Glycomyces sp. L485 TaxID=2909235 RepID=UPI001F4B11A8|nr:recombinase family protein [Glycomyces sp. L485]MCH7229596.1 recombinase family protein [Glycomyces sp. L485]
MTISGIYVRISQDRGGAGLGVARQEEDCRALCERKGWAVAEVYVDNDTSAYSGAPRPAWQRLIADSEAGAVDAVVCWHVDRLTRTPRELEDVIDLADRLGLQLGTVAGDIDLATPTGRMVARMLGAAARHESEHKAERQRREHQQRAEAGKFSGGGHRPFGYTRIYDTTDPDRPRRFVRDEINDDEAAIVREAAARALTGETLSSICRELKARDVKTSAGNHFMPHTLRLVLCSARISGRREHKPRDSYQGTRPILGQIVAEAVWPAIITPEDSDALRATLTRPERRKHSGPTGRKYMLSGILRCGKCGHQMSNRPRSGTPRYVCPNLPGGKSCGGTATNGAKTDELIRDMVLEALASPNLAERLQQRGAPNDGLAERIRTAEDRADELAADWAAGEITRSEWRTAKDVLDKQLERDRETLARSTQTRALNGFLGVTPGQIRLRWDGLGTGQRTAVVAAVVERIIVHPANPRKRWDPDRFEIVWRA